MANLNHYVAVARLTADPEKRAVGNGLTAFRVAVNNSRKNKQSGEWEDDPLFLDCEAWNQGERGKLADQVCERAKKGSRVVVSGRLKMDTWEDKNGGGKRQKIKLAVDDVQFLDRTDAATQQQSNAPAESGPADSTTPPDDGGAGGEIPF